MLSKRLAEVNEELNKTQARNVSLQKELDNTIQILRAEEAKLSGLNEQVKDLTAADSTQADTLNSLTAKLQEATARISELEKMLSGFENQLKASQEIQMQKDKEIQASWLVDFNDKYLFSPYKITTSSNKQVMRIKKMITKDGMS